MAAKLPHRYKTDDELTVEDMLAIQRAEAADEPRPRFERDEYRQARADALRAAGFEEEADELDAPAAGAQLDADELDALTPDQLHRHLGAHR